MAKKTILVIDDDLGIRDMVTDVLASDDINVNTIDSVTDLDELVKHVTDLHPCVILLDLWLPGITGEEIVRAIKGSDSTKNFPVILMSAHKSTDEIAQNTGANGSLRKPFDIDELEKLINQYC